MNKEIIYMRFWNTVCIAIAHHELVSESRVIALWLSVWLVFLFAADVFNLRVRRKLCVEVAEKNIKVNALK